ncbi:MAG: hypothetical protein AB8U25_02050 [Rickettsiales endosymbiont of Dermacentor nuttalli]
MLISQGAIKVVDLILKQDTQNRFMSYIEHECNSVSDMNDTLGARSL